MSDRQFLQSRTPAEKFNSRFRQQENPVEAILVVFVVVLLFVPRAGCGITANPKVAAASDVGVVTTPAETPRLPAAKP